MGSYYCPLSLYNSTGLSNKQTNLPAFGQNKVRADIPGSLAVFQSEKHASARRAEGGFGGNSARRARLRNQFEYFRTYTANWDMARPLRGLATRFSLQNRVFYLLSPASRDGQKRALQTNL